MKLPSLELAKTHRKWIMPVDRAAFLPLRVNFSLSLERSIFPPAYKFFARISTARRTSSATTFRLQSNFGELWHVVPARVDAREQLLRVVEVAQILCNSETQRAPTFSSAFSSRMRTHRKVTATLNVRPIRSRDSASSSQPVHSKIQLSRLFFTIAENSETEQKRGWSNEIGRRGTAPDRHRDATGGFVAAPRERTHRPPWCDPPPLTPTRIWGEATPFLRLFFVLAASRWDMIEKSKPQCPVTSSQPNDALLAATFGLLTLVHRCREIVCYRKG